MVTVTDRSSRSTTSRPSPFNRATPSSDGDVFNTSMSGQDLNLENLRLNSPTASSSSDIYTTSTRRTPNFTPETETQPPSSSSSPTPSARILTPQSSTAPSTISTGQPTPSISSSSSSSGLPHGLTIDFSLSIPTHGSPSRTPYQFTGPDYPLPSIEGTSFAPEQSRSSIPYGSPNPTITSSSRQASVAPERTGDSASTPTRSSVTRPQGLSDRTGSIASQIRQIRISDNSSSPRPETQPREEATQSRFLSPMRGDVDGDIGQGNGSPGRARPSAGRRRRSSSQLNQAPHNVSDEEPPEDDFNNHAFQRSFAATRELMVGLEATLGSSNLHLEPDSTIRRLRQKAGELARFQCPPTRTVGFVGDSGVGKSSLLNSLLDRRGLARASNSGAACTCVVTEYHYHDDPGFNVKVDFFTDDELEAQLTEMVHAYRRQHLGPPTTDREEQKDILDRAQVAKDTFDAMFRTRAQYAGGRFVLGSQPEETIVSTMLEWAEETIGDSAGMAEGITVNSQEDCSRLLAQLTSERHDPQRPNGNTTSTRPSTNTSQQTEHSLWPFIKKIRVHVNAHILGKGLILVDLPGLRDLNSARQNITERYILECDEIFAVCCIGRAVTDVGVKTVFDLARQARLSNVGIVCTKSDDINPHEALTDWKGVEGRELERRIDQLKVFEDELKVIKARIDELIGFQEEDELDNDEISELERLPLRVISKEKIIDSLKFEQDRYLIQTRNQMVKTQLNGLYRDTIPGGNLKVFCVSNKLYWQHRQAVRDKALPWLQLSGIIGLRRHCTALVSDSQLRIATNYMNNDVRSLVSSVDLWVQSGAGTETAERKALVRETLDVIEARLKRDLSGREGPFARVRRTLADEFYQQIYSRRLISQWTRGAVDASRDWAGWHHSSYAAFCRNYGNHCTPTIGSRNWNEEANARMVRDMTPRWDPFCVAATEQRPDETMAAVDEVMDWAIEYLDNQLGQEDVSAEILNQALESRQGVFVTDMGDAFRVFKAGLRTLQKNLLSSHRTSLMGESMEDAYDACRRESGTGSDARRKSIIARTLSDEGLFQDIMDRLHDGFITLAEDLEDALQNVVRGNLAAIGETMNILRDENVIAESERDGEFRRRVEEEVRRIRGALPARSTRESRS